MTREDKQLLLKDICARFPYGVKCIDYERNSLVNADDLYSYIHSGWYIDLKPYLRPMSSMTEGEKECLKNNFRFYFDECSGGITNGIHSFVFNRTIYQTINEDDISDVIDWLNAHHFDYRDLIPRGLALEAPEDMYK